MPRVRLPAAWLSRRTARERCVRHRQVTTDALPGEPAMTRPPARCPECRDERSLFLTTGGALCASAALPAAALYVAAPIAPFAGSGTTLLTVAVGLALLFCGLGLIAAGARPVLGAGESPPELRNRSPEHG